MLIRSRSFSEKPGLSSTALKLIALLLMTVDHLGAYAYSLPIVAPRVALLRLIGRLAAPIFLFCLTESALHTGDKKRFLLRLWLASIVTGLVNSAVGLFVFGGRVRLYNIFQNLAWAVAFMYMLDYIALAVKDKNYRRALLCLAGIFTLTLTTEFLCAYISSPRFRELSLLRSLDSARFAAVKNALTSVISSPSLESYSLGLIFLGCLWYFTTSVPLRCLEMLLLCLLGAAGLFPVCLETVMFTGNQWAMMFCIPFLLLYNGERGRAIKGFFYLYYPLHIYLLAYLNLRFGS